MVHPDLASLYEHYGYAVHRRCLYLLGSEDEAWDAVQEVFLRANAGLARFEGRSSPRTWLDTIATRHCLNVLRARRVRTGRGLAPVESLDEGRALEDLYPAGDPGVVTALTVRAVLSQFDPQTQEAAVFYFVDELSQEDVATRVGLSVPTLRKRLDAFLERARRQLSRSEGGTR
jgi:RNA polymerase sigma factor (sigma-70 family)